MQHFFGTRNGSFASLDQAGQRRLLDVKRAEVGEEIEVTIEGVSYRCIVASLNPLKIEIIDETVSNRELPISVSIAFSVLKGDHNELIVLKGTELGVASFAPFLSSRSIVRPEGKEDRKLLRLRLIAKEGAEQCRREKIPSVLPYQKFSEILNAKADFRLFAFEGESLKGTAIREAVAGIRKGASVLVVIGPEGGFSEEEVEMAKEAGFQFVGLGKRILRAETAALYAASVLSEIGEEL